MNGHDAPGKVNAQLLSLRVLADGLGSGMFKLLHKAAWPITVVVPLTMASASVAQTVADDAKCLLVSNTYARTSTTQEARVIAGSTAAFYLGRIDGRVSPTALKAALAAQHKLLTAANGPAIMKACTERLGQVERSVSAMALPANPPARSRGER
jgi:hypothetical protein